VERPASSTRSRMDENRHALNLDGYAGLGWLPEISARVHPTQARRESDAAHLVELISRCSCGQEEALAELYDLTSSGIYGIVLCVVRSTDLAARITQEVYVEVWRQSARYSLGAGSVLRWVLTMAHRKALDRVRSATI